MTKPTTNLRPEVALALADLLESGEFKQCKDRLRRGAKLCAEGALCELYRRQVQKGRWRGNNFDAGQLTMARHGSPGVVLDWATTDGKFTRLGGKYMARLNDQGTTFPELARMLREAAGGQSDG